VLGDNHPDTLVSLSSLAAVRRAPEGLYNGRQLVLENVVDDAPAILHEPTGRPCNPDQKYNSRHRDIPSCSPLFVFGHGLSYTSFEVANLRLSSSTVSKNRSLQASVTVTNTGSSMGDEVVQLYLAGRSGARRVQRP
jgi:hypothetical protein